MSAAAPHILVADGDGERGRQIAEAFNSRGLSCQLAAHGGSALELALEDVPRVLVAQVGLPVIDGPRLAAILRANPRTRGLEVFFLADRDEETARDDLSGRVLPPAVAPEAVAGLVQATLAGPAQARREPVPAPEAGGVEGELSQLALADLLELFQASRRTGSVELVQDLGRGRRREGRAWLREGELVAATAGGVRAEKALYRMLAWDRGNFAFRPAPVDVETEIHTPTRALLREGLRQLREWQQLAEELPPLGARASLRIPRAALPSVIHPLTQEVLLALELGSRVGDVVDRCAFPDYQVLRTLHTLVQRGMVELRLEPEAVIPAADSRLFTSPGAARLREWLDLERPGGLAARQAKVLVIAADAAAAQRFGALLAQLPGAALDAEAESGRAPDALVRIARLAVDEQVGIELIQCPADPRFAPLWPLAAHGALATLLLLGAPAGRAAASLRPAARALAAAPRARLFTLVLLAAGERAFAEELAGHLPPLAADAFTPLGIDAPAEAVARLRELLARLLP